MRKMLQMKTMILQKIEPGFYDDYIVYEHGKPVLYVHILKAIYGTY